jgi:hypothetical protein
VAWSDKARRAAILARQLKRKAHPLDKSVKWYHGTPKGIRGDSLKIYHEFRNKHLTNAPGRKDRAFNIFAARRLTMAQQYAMQIRTRTSTKDNKTKSLITFGPVYVVKPPRKYFNRHNPLQFKAQHVDLNASDWGKQLPRSQARLSKYATGVMVAAYDRPVKRLPTLRTSAAKGKVLKDWRKD